MIFFFWGKKCWLDKIIKYAGMIIIVNLWISIFLKTLNSIDPKTVGNIDTNYSYQFVLKIFGSCLCFPYTMKNTFCNIDATNRLSFMHILYLLFHIKPMDVLSHLYSVVCNDWQGEGWVPFRSNQNTSQCSSQISSGFHMPCLLLETSNY